METYFGFVAHTQSYHAPSAGIASTVLDCTGDAPRVLRAGALTLEDMKGCLS